MDFRQTVQPNRPSAGGAPQPMPAHDEARHDMGMGNPKKDVSVGKWIKVFSVVMLAGIAVLLAAIAFGVGRSPTDNEAKYVDHSKYQAVFLNNGQVYFGNVDSINDKYIHMTNIYYLTQGNGSTSSSSSNTSYSLIKLGCQQIHDPYDAMVINRTEVTFWENLQAKGKVVSSINKFKQQNPNGPDCTQVSSQTQATSSTTQGSTTTPTSTNSTSTGSTK